MKLLDLYCGAGGAAMGYSRAGFTEIVGVDNVAQPHYPFTFVKADALEYVSEHGKGFDAIHASPPCYWTRASKLREAQRGESLKPKLLAPTRDLLVCIDKPFVIENVEGAPMRPDLKLCGSMFGLRVRRHRWFESNVTMPLVSPCNHYEQGRPTGVYHRMNDEIPHGGRTAKNMAEATVAMGIDWMIWDELKEAIPPAYTELIGRQLLNVVVARPR